MKERILALVKSKGPLIPKTVAKEFRLDTTFAGAYLSELVSNKKILVSNTKIGGSPTYYYPDQKEKLQELYKYLNDKDKKTYDLLKEKKVLRDNGLVPLVRASLRMIKDFAVPLQVNTQPKPELFWKWYMLTKEEAEPIIKGMLGVGKDNKKTKEKAGVEQEPKKEEQRKLEEEKDTQPESKYEKNPEKTNNVTEDKPKEKPTVASEEKIETKKKEAKKQEKKAEKKAVKQNTAEVKKPKPKADTNNDFLDEINKHFTHDKIDILHSEIIKKTEIDFIISIPSGVGKLEYYCKAKKKKKCNEGDLSSAFVTGQMKKLPILFVTTGDLTKKAQEMLKNEFKNYLVLKKI